jgi:hypothetical protein
MPTIAMRIAAMATSFGHRRSVVASSANNSIDDDASTGVGSIGAGL